MLRPGGRLVIGDMHWETLAWASDDPARMAEVLQVWDHHLADRLVPERLPGAGFGGITITPLHFTDFTLRRDGLAAMMLRLVEAFASESELGPETARAWAAEQEARAADRTFFFTIMHCVTAATRA